MPDHLAATRILLMEARALLTRLGRVKSFALQETMVPAASISLAAQVAIEHFLVQGRRELKQMVNDYMGWLRSERAESVPPAEAQRRFTVLRMRFNTILSQFDIFADVMTQRSEYETGVWLAGLDAFAADALDLPGRSFVPPPVICYLDRGHGAAIRRARTRLPGGVENPVAVVRVPRERMVGSGIASSLVHEAGHQGSAMLDLVESMRLALQEKQREQGREKVAWVLWERWISEILADFWSVARVGVSGTIGLMGVVSLPRAFVFRVSLDDPHPIPWIRVKLSAAIGRALYPHPQWARLSTLWDAFYPLIGLDEDRRSLITALEECIPAFVDLLVNHRSAALGGRALKEIMGIEMRQPAQLKAYFEAFRAGRFHLDNAPPSLVFAIIGQARADGKISPEGESRLVADLLTEWALRRNLLDYKDCASQPARSKIAPAAIEIPDLVPELFY